MLRICHIQTPVGDVAIGSDNGAIVGCGIAGQRIYQQLIEQGEECPSEAALVQGRAWLERYFAGERPSPQELPLAPRETEVRLAASQAGTFAPWRIAAAEARDRTAH